MAIFYALHDKLHAEHFRVVLRHLQHDKRVANMSQSTILKNIIKDAWMKAGLQTDNWPQKSGPAPGYVRSTPVAGYGSTGTAPASAPAAAPASAPAAAPAPGPSGLITKDDMWKEYVEVHLEERLAKLDKITHALHHCVGQLREVLPLGHPAAHVLATFEAAMKEALHYNL